MAATRKVILKSKLEKERHALVSKSAATAAGARGWRGGGPPAVPRWVPAPPGSLGAPI